MTLDRKSTVAVTAREILGFPGRMISASKGQYQDDNENHIVVFNSNVVTPVLGTDSMGASIVGYEKIWYGDIDVTLQEHNLFILSSQLGYPLYVLPESAARFENESDPDIERFKFYTDGRNAELNKFSTEVTRDAYGHAVLPAQVEAAELSYTEYLEISKQYNQEQFRQVPGIEFNVQDMFDGVTKSTSPLHTFQEMCVVAGSLTAEDSLSVWMTESDYTELKRLTGLWIRAYSPYATDYRIEKDTAMFMLMYSPMTFAATPEWAEDGYLYKKNKS